MANYFGIDFGTTNSAVVAIATDVDGNKVSELQIGEERRPLPSYVAIHKTTGVVQTGLEAKNSISDMEEYAVFSSIKSIIGEDKEWEIAGKTWTQIDIAAELFKAMKNNVKQRANMKLERAVVAVPIGFSCVKKNNIRKAAKKAGIDVTMFISEPTAAYCSRSDIMKKYHNVAVFDWGGGTLDVIVLRVEGSIIRELATAGIPLAGNDIDRKLAERICLMVAHKKNIDFSMDDLSSDIQLRLMSICEQAKCNLADEDLATITMARLGDYGRVLEKIDYNYFSLLIENEVERAVDCLMKALHDAGMNAESIDCILCEGGSSRLRPLQTRLLQIFDRKKLVFPRQAMWDIGTGAADVAYKPGSYTLNKPIGVMLSNNRFYPLLKVGQRVPTEEKTISFGVVEKTKEARFIMTDGETEKDQTFTEYFAMKLRGFSDEIIKLSCYIDADMVFRMKVWTNRTPDEYFRVWTYSNLKVSYDIDAPLPDVENDDVQA
ncbi:Hsp70 family protein [Bacillota bacterium LCP21S3_D9]